MVVLLLVSLAQFLTTIFVPAAPPRFAHMFGESLAVEEAEPRPWYRAVWDGMTGLFG